MSLKEKVGINNDYQISVNDIEAVIQANNYRQVISDRLNLIGEQFYSKFEYHDVNHALRVALFSLVIANYIKIDKNDFNLIIDAALLHDVGRVDDYEDFNHEKLSAKIALDIKKIDSYYDVNKINLLLAIIEGHRSDVCDNLIPKSYNVEEIDKYQRLLKIIKDADILDRTRLFKISLIDINELNYEISKRLFKFAININKNDDRMKKDGLIEQIINNINNFLRQYRHLLSKQDFNDIKEKVLDLAKSNINSYKELKDIENWFLKYYSKIWKSKLSSFDKFDGLDDFRFIVTSPTVSAEKYDMKSTVSATLITNKHMGTFNKIPIGIVLDIREDSILGISENDMNSIVVDKNDVVASYYYLNSLANKKIYSKKRVMSLMTPEQIEMSLIYENVRTNGNILLQGIFPVYSDILLNNENIKMSGIIVIEPCDKEWLIQAEKLSSKFGLKIKKINIEHYYQKFGIINSKTMMKEYDLYDLNLIEKIPDRIHFINSYNSNIYVEQIGKNYCVRENETDDYILYIPEKQEAEIIIKGDSRLIKICFNGIKISYYIDDNQVNGNEIQQILDSAKNRNNLKK